MTTVPTTMPCLDMTMLAPWVVTMTKPAPNGASGGRDRGRGERTVRLDQQRGVQHEEREAWHRNIRSPAYPRQTRHDRAGDG
jgi:hypothetical protein